MQNFRCIVPVHRCTILIYQYDNNYHKDRRYLQIAKTLHLWISCELLLLYMDKYGHIPVLLLFVLHFFVISWRGRERGGWGGSPIYYMCTQITHWLLLVTRHRALVIIQSWNRIKFNLWCSNLTLSLHWG
jgi:hypothetical protein